MSPAGTLIVFAKAPEVGQVKTRMTPALSAEEARGLYACLLDDVLAESARAGAMLDLELLIAGSPPERLAELALLAPPGFRVVAQHGPDLSARMQRAVQEAGAAGALPVLLRGSDSPTLDRRLLADALAALSDADLVVCPDPDGGYSLVGVRQAAHEVFAHAMSTPTVLSDTLARAGSLGLRSRQLEARFDLDRVDDLRRLAEARLREPALPCPRTLAYLDEHDLWSRVDTGR